MNYCIKYNTFTKQSFISLLLVFGIIFLSDDCLLFSTNENKIFFYAKFIYIFAITSIMFIYDLLNQKQFEKKTMSFCFLMILISFLNIIATQDFLFGNFCRICLFVYSLCIIRRLSINTFLCNLEYRKLTDYKKIFNILLSTHFIEFLKVNFKNVEMWVPDINELYREYKKGDDDPYIRLTFGENNG